MFAEGVMLLIFGDNLCRCTGYVKVTIVVTSVVCPNDCSG